MTDRTYPPNWPYRNILPSLYPQLLKDVEELKAYWAEGELSGKFLHFRGTNTKIHTHITDKDIGLWFISCARKLDRPIHPILTGVRNPVRKTDHFHSIIGLSFHDDEWAFVEKTVNAAWRDGASRVMRADLNQEPFSPLEYIAGKHNWIRGHRDVYVPRRMARFFNKK